MLTLLNLLLKQVNTCARIFLGVVASLTTGLDLPVTPFLGEPCETWLEWPATRMMIHQRGIYASRMAEF